MLHEFEHDVIVMDGMAHREARGLCCKGIMLYPPQIHNPLSITPICLVMRIVAQSTARFLLGHAGPLSESRMYMSRYVAIVRLFLFFACA